MKRCTFGNVKERRIDVVMALTPVENMRAAISHERAISHLTDSQVKREFEMQYRLMLSPSAKNVSLFG